MNMIANFECLNGLGWVGLRLMVAVMGWVGLGWVVKVMGWVGLDLIKWTHVHVCHAQVAKQPHRPYMRVTVDFRM